MGVVFGGYLDDSSDPFKDKREEWAKAEKLCGSKHQWTPYPGVYNLFVCEKCGEEGYQIP